jgi:hypothetical protein
MPNGKADLVFFAHVYVKTEVFCAANTLNIISTSTKLQYPNNK